MSKTTIIYISLLFTFVFTLPSFADGISLEGKWKIFFASENKDFSSPVYDDSKWPEIYLPNKKLMPDDMINLFALYNIELNKEQKEGYYWLRKSFYLHEIPENNLSLFIREIMNADIVYLNGIIIGQSGSFPPNFRSAWANARLYPFPQNVLKKGNNVLAIKIYFNAESWIMSPIIIDDYGKLSKKKLLFDFLLIDLIESFSVLLCAISIFFMLFFIKRQKEIEYLYFAISSLCISIALSLHFIENRYSALPISSNAILIFSQAGLIFFPSFLSLFLKQYISHKVTKMRLVFSLIIPITGTIMMIISYNNRFNIIFYRNIFLLLISVFIFDAIINSIIQYKKGNTKALIFFYAMIPLFIFAFHDILSFSFNVINDSIPLYIYGVPFLLFVLASFLTTRFVNSLNDAEKLNVTLRNMMDSFARFVPVEFLRHLNKNNITEVMLGDAIINNMTVLFMDIRNFTGLTENMNPDEIVKFLNSFLKNMEPNITTHNGFIDKFIGDAIMALFSESATSAVRSAISMREKLKEYNSYRLKQGYNIIDFGIGINSGEVVLGTVGSKNRLETTVIGDTVNLAARMEELTKLYKTPILITHLTYNKLSDPAEFYIRKIDMVKVRGRNTPVTIYEVFNSDSEDIITIKLDLLNLFNEALEYYKNSDFKSALKSFIEYYKQLPQDSIVKLFIRRCKYYIANPPDPNWDGITIIK